MPMTSFKYLYCQLWTDFTPFSRVSIVHIEQVYASLEIASKHFMCVCLDYYQLTFTFSKSPIETLEKGAKYVQT